MNDPVYQYLMLHGSVFALQSLSESSKNVLMDKPHQRDTRWLANLSSWHQLAHY